MLENNGKSEIHTLATKSAQRIRFIFIFIFIFILYKSLS